MEFNFVYVIYLQHQKKSIFNLCNKKINIVFFLKISLYYCLIFLNNVNEKKKHKKYNS